MGKIVFAFAVIVCSFSWAFAQTESVRPSVSVVGEAEMSVSPDQVVFTFEVVTTGKEVAAAKQANDRAAARTLAAAESFTISTEDVQTDSLTVSPRYTGDKDPRGARVLLGYEVTKRILVTLKDLGKIDEFLAKAIEAGVNRVSNISIENSQMQKHQEDVRTLAVKNARDKAAAYAKQIGQTVGRAYLIREEEADNPLGSSGNGSGNGEGWGDPNSQGDITDLKTPTAYGREITFALGKIKVEEKIYVIFELNRQ